MIQHKILQDDAGCFISRTLWQVFHFPLAGVNLQDKYN